MRILIVKLSSLGDVIHTFPVVQDLRGHWPGARIDWVVERGFAPLVQSCEGVARVIPCELRRWRRAPWSATTRAEWRDFRRELQREAYDLVIDLHGLSKSALMAWLARLAPGGRRVAMANRTEGSSYEAPTRWVAHQVIRLEPHVHALVRGRQLCAQAIGYTLPPLRHGLAACRPAPSQGAGAIAANEVLLVHGTSRDDKCWPLAHWVELGHRLVQHGARVGLVHGSAPEEERSRQMAEAIGPGAQVWPRMALDQLAHRMAGCAGVVGVDSGLSHLAVALDLAHVQIYNFDTAWRTGPLNEPGHAPRQCSAYGHPTPSVEAVWQAWGAMRAASLGWAAGASREGAA